MPEKCNTPRHIGHLCAMPRMPRHGVLQGACPAGPLPPLFPLTGNLCIQAVCNDVRPTPWRVAAGYEPRPATAAPAQLTCAVMGLGVGCVSSPGMDTEAARASGSSSCRGGVGWNKAVGSQGAD